MSYAEFDYWFVKKYVPDHICDVIIENYTDFTEGMIRTNELNDVRKSGVCWVNEPFYKNLVFDIICRQNNLSFDLLKPLLKETIEKLNNLSPKQSQTGPAIRNDNETISKHIKLITKDRLKEIYKVLTSAIKECND